MNPFATLFQSRKFWLLILDVVVSMATYFVTKYAAPEAATDILFVLGGLQPVFVALIAAIAYEDNGERKLTSDMQRMKREFFGMPDPDEKPAE